jgi:transcription antitermination factor NusG
MQKNWYMLYTKPKCEKKVAALLAKKKIENFLPLNATKITSFRKNKSVLEPLFKSYIFVNIAENQAPLVMQTDGVISLLHWMGHPAIVREDEIAAMKEFVSDYSNIELERSRVSMHACAELVEGPICSMDGKIFALKNKSVKVNLPSIGYILVAKMEEESIFGKKSTFFQNRTLSNS